MQRGPQHFLLHRNRWRNGASQQKPLCGSHRRKAVSGHEEHEPRFAFQTSSVGAVPAATRRAREEPTSCGRNLGSLSRLADVRGAPTPQDKRPTRPPPPPRPALPHPGPVKAGLHRTRTGSDPPSCPWPGDMQALPAARRVTVPPLIHPHP